MRARSSHGSAAARRQRRRRKLFVLLGQRRRHERRQLEGDAGGAALEAIDGEGTTLLDANGHTGGDLRAEKEHTLCRRSGDDVTGGCGPNLVRGDTRSRDKKAQRARARARARRANPEPVGRGPKPGGPSPASQALVSPPHPSPSPTRGEGALLTNRRAARRARPWPRGPERRCPSRAPSLRRYR